VKREYFTFAVCHFTLNLSLVYPKELVVFNVWPLKSMENPCLWQFSTAIWEKLLGFSPFFTSSATYKEGL
jgi:hypothetical protein